jgi:hypothetical protein
VAEAEAWASEMCHSLGMAIVAPIEQVHVRPWSTVFRVPTTGGALYLKCCGTMQAHEPHLTALLHRELPGLVTEVLALHPDRPWMLVADGGRPLGEVFSGDEVLRAWCEILPRYAELQRDVAPRIPDIVAFGTPDHRAEPLIAAFEEVVANEPRVSGRRSDRLTTEERRALTLLRPMLVDALHVLNALGIDDTLNHDDLHHNNVLVRDRRMVIFDWGDACVSHPFLTLAVTLRFAAQKTGRAEDSAEIVAVRDAYLEPWSDRASARELRDAAELGRRIGQVSRTLTFYAVARAYPGVNDTYPGGLAGSLRRVLALFR